MFTLRYALEKSACVSASIGPSPPVSQYSHGLEVPERERINDEKGGSVKLPSKTTPHPELKLTRPHNFAKICR